VYFHGKVDFKPVDMKAQSEPVGAPERATAEVAPK
jgi:hypothetical protein